VIKGWKEIGSFTERTGYVRRHDKPIITSLADVDFYKNAMGQMIYHKHPNASVNFSFLNRTKSVPLARVIDKDRLWEELQHCRTLRFSPQELHYLMGTYEYNQPMFKLDYINFLKELRLPEFSLGETDDQLELNFFGNWAEVTYWETLAMSIVNELYYRHLTFDFSRFELERIEAEGRIRLAKKVDRLNAKPGMTFSDFGTRRRFSKKWQDYVVGVLTEECGARFKGTSNVALAMKYGVMPVGTNAHELPMVYSGIYWKEDDKDPTHSHRQVLKDWEEEYGLGLSVFLPDTVSSDWFFKNVASLDQLKRWKGSRQDSGDPLGYAKARIAEYQAADIDPLSKLIVFADGQNVESMVRISEALNRKVGYTFGWGTDLTNDLGFVPISIVVKATRANANPVAKLSDNIAKATGPSEAVERMKRLVNYNVTFNQECKS
jgi:nicotinate phosphoribosyltransferase